MEFFGRILLMSQWHDQFYEIVEKKTKIQQLISFHLLNLLPDYQYQNRSRIPTALTESVKDPN